MILDPSSLNFIFEYIIPFLFVATLAHSKVDCVVLNIAIYEAFYPDGGHHVKVIFLNDGSDVCPIAARFV